MFLNRESCLSEAMKSVNSYEKTEATKDCANLFIVYFLKKNSIKNGTMSIILLTPSEGRQTMMFSTMSFCHPMTGGNHS